MESGLVSWQFENFSSAELIISPPVSPSPPSPSLYNNGGSSSAAPRGKSPKNIHRAQIASNILSHLEEQGPVKMEFNDFGMNWNEESVNLSLFDELEELENTPPASPKLAFDQQPSSSYGQIQTPQAVHSLNNGASESATDISVLTAEFQAILDSLPKDSLYNTDVISEVLKNAGIPTTIVDGEALVPVELDLSAITHPDSIHGLGIMEVDDLNADVIDESELYDLSDVSNVASPASSTISSRYESMEEHQYEIVDHHSAAAERILDALLQGDVATAETFLPGIDESSMSSHQSSEYYCEEEDENDSDDSYHPIASSSSRQAALQDSEPKKQERRGRKPGKKVSKTSAAYVKDKTLRKKEQNKTAATRYRQKKKMEFALILESEAELQKEHDALEKKKDDLHREILMVKQLLRDVIKARKPTTSTTSVVKSTVPVGRTHNRRK